MNEIIFLTPDLSTGLPLLYADAGIPAGFPSPAQHAWRDAHWEEDLQRAYDAGRKMAEL